MVLSMKITINRYSHDQAANLLKEMSPQFSPALSDSLELDSYADKLANNALFLTCSDEDGVNGCIVFYPNNTTSIMYVPLVWVGTHYRGIGIARRMFEILIEYGKQKGFSYIDLEVLKDNIPANNLYESLGFSKLQDRSEKYLMRLSILSVSKSLQDK